MIPYKIGSFCGGVLHHSVPSLNRLYSTSKHYTTKAEMIRDEVSSVAEKIDEVFISTELQKKSLMNIRQAERPQKFAFCGLPKDQYYDPTKHLDDDEELQAEIAAMIETMPSFDEYENPRYQEGLRIAIDRLKSYISNRS